MHTHEFNRGDGRHGGAVWWISHRLNGAKGAFIVNTVGLVHNVQTFVKLTVAVIPFIFILKFMS